MTTRYTDLPEDRHGRHGERALVQRLDSWDDVQLHVWCALDGFPGSGIDLLLVHEDAGAFVVEVKAVPITAVREYTALRCTIQGRPSHRTPLQQARDGMDSLNEYLRRWGTGPLPWLTATACWPNVTRADWVLSWTHPALVAQAEGMIFAEDLATALTLRDRLRVIEQAPQIGPSPDRRYVHDPAFITTLDAVLSAGGTRAAAAHLATPEPADGDVAAFHETPRLRAAERIHVRGLPGTGKTRLLLDIALDRASTGAKTLFTCFNKTLAAEVQWKAETDPRSSGLFDALEVSDVFDLLRQTYPIPGPGREERGFEDWAEAAVAALESSAAPTHDGYATVVIDEAQDLPEWTMRMIVALARPDVTIHAASGAGQNLYRAEPPGWLVEFRAQATDRELRRSFRGRRMGFLAAQLFYDLAEDTSSIPTWRHWASAGKGLPIDLPTASGSPPVIRRVPTPEADEYPRDDEVRASLWERAWSQDIEAVLSQQLTDMGPDSLPRDLLILVPSRRSPLLAPVHRALTQLSGSRGTSYLDLTPEGNRRSVATPDQVRVCTFHSSRGLEARRVIVLGFGEVESLPTALNQPESMRHLGYIVLSRATELTTLMVPSHTGSRAVSFLSEVGEQLVRRLTSDDAPGRQPNRVNHSRFGLGTVLEWGQEYALVDFGSAGVKSVRRGDVQRLD